MTEPVGRVGALIRLLGSDEHGEVIAAPRALDRTLKQAQCDWPWLGEHGRCFLRVLIEVAEQGYVGERREAA
jgi:hypothetical protein